MAPALRLDAKGIVTAASIYLGAVTSFPAPAIDAAESLIGNQLTAEAITKAARLARKTSSPLSNTDFAPPWRGLMVEKYTEAALREIAGLPVERLSPKHSFGAA